LPNVLAVSRYFPPLSSAGASIRLVKFIKYSAREDWHFTVITQDPNRPVIPESNLSDFLLEEIPADANIIRIGNPIFGTTLINRIAQKIFGSSSLPWGISVFWKVLSLHHQIKADLIFVNSPPFTNAAIGFGLAVILKVPFVLDMKDDWIGSAKYENKGKLRQAFDRWIEREIVKKAKKVAVVTKSSFMSCTQRYSPYGLADKFAIIPNGEDLEEFNQILGRTRKKEGESFRIQTAAAGYRPDYRDLSPLLKALELFLLHNPVAREQIEIEFIGDVIDPVYKVWLEKLLPVKRILNTELLNRNQLVERLWMADLFFLVQPKGNRTAISGTLYEYWATGKAPILLFSEEGASSEIVIQNNLGGHFNFKEIEESSRFIEKIYKGFVSFQPIWIERNGVEKFDRKELSRQMVDIWSDAIQTSGENNG
jgi:hypothetical protein